MYVIELILILFTGCTKLHTKLNVMYQTVLWIPAQLEHCYSNSQGQAHQNLNTKEQMWTWAVVQPRWEICYPDNMQETDDVEFWDSISSLLFVSTQSSWSGSTGFRITSIETPVLYSVRHTLALIIAVIHHGSCRILVSKLNMLVFQSIPERFRRLISQESY